MTGIKSASTTAIAAALGHSIGSLFPIEQTAAMNVLAASGLLVAGYLAASRLSRRVLRISLIIFVMIISSLFLAVLITR